MHRRNRMMAAEANRRKPTPAELTASNLTAALMENGNLHMVVLQKDAASMRECLAWLHGKVPLVLQSKIDTTLKGYAAKVKVYCGHPQSVFIQKEDAQACLDCGTRFQVKK